MARPREHDPLERLGPEDFESTAEMEAEARAGREGQPHGDDSLMQRFDRWGLRRFSGWDAVSGNPTAATLQRLGLEWAA